MNRIIVSSTVLKPIIPNPRELVTLFDVKSGLYLYHVIYESIYRRFLLNDKNFLPISDLLPRFIANIYCVF